LDKLNETEKNIVLKKQWKCDAPLRKMMHLDT